MAIMTITEPVYVQVNQVPDAMPQEEASVRQIINRTTLPYSSTETYNDLSSHTGTVLGYTAVGAGVGALCGIPGGPPGIAIGAGVGAAVGATIGGYRVHKDRVVAFEKWKERERDPETLNQIIKLFRDEFPMSDEIVCESDGFSVMEMPLITPCGHVFDKQILHDWLVVNKHNTCIKCRHEPITFAQLKVDYVALGKLNILAINLLQRKAGELQISAQQRKGVEALAADTQTRVMCFFTREEVSLWKRREKREISPMVFAEKYTGLMKAFSMPELAHLLPKPKKEERKEEKKA